MQRKPYEAESAAGVDSLTAWKILKETESTSAESEAVRHPERKKSNGC
jgi:hypothetical protein